MTAKLARTRTKTIAVPTTPEFKDSLQKLIEEATNNHATFKMINYAQENKYNPAELRRFISTSFGSNVVFRKGRGGGAVWVPSTPVSEGAVVA